MHQYIAPLRIVGDAEAVHVGRMEKAGIGLAAARPAGRGLRIGLWAVQVLLALFFLMAGFNHGVRPIAEAAKTSPWITGVSTGLARFIGFAELVGAVGLILPAAARIGPSLTPLAAVGLAIIMALAVPFHIMRGEANVIGLHVVVVALSAFVAWGRYRRAPIAARRS
jgi:putative oxidoreductase